MMDFVLPVSADTLITATLMYGGFFAALFVGAWLGPGIHREGFPQPDGPAKRYKLNGLLLFLVTTAIVLGGIPFGLTLTPVLTHFWSLFVVANLFAIGWAVQLFISGRRDASYKSQSVIHDLWFGPIRNPTVLGVDMKMFAYHPSLIGLWIVVAAFAFRQYEVHGTITPQMWAFQAFWWVYLFTHYVREDFMLSTWDIIAEHFGFMLTWGDLAFVTFFYGIGGWFLVDQTEPMATPLLAGIVALHVLGHWIFRGANWQKDRYKRDKSTNIWGKPAETIGGRLLVSGWWGVGRKINYTGEILVYISIALTTGFTSIVPYILPFWLISLLIHRAYRDEKKCREKYGELWEQYCQRARFRIVPFLY